MPSRRAVLRFVAWFATVAAVGLLAPHSARAAAGAPALLIVGDSISAGYGLPAGASWVDLLAARIESERYPLHVVNASITGDTTAGGRARLQALLARHQPAIVIVELGGNDGLRGGNLKSTRDNLDAMIAAAQHAGAKVLVVGTRLPPNYGLAYTREFGALFGELAKARNTALVPNLFEGFAERNEFFQPDRIHPTAAAQPQLLDNVWPALKPLLGKPR
jgi:acyl-CoA thioesterase-1